MSTVQSVMTYLILIVASVAGIIFISSLIGRRLLTKEKDTRYECGMEPTEKPQSRFPAAYYRIAILFVVFDVEIVFLFLWAVVLRALGVTGLWLMFVFIAVLLAAWVYVRVKGDLQWD